MPEPLVVPGHYTDNPATDNYWPRLLPDLTPQFEPEDGSPLGPYRCKKAHWIFGTDDPEPLSITDPELAVTDSRIVVLGPIGAGSPPDRRLMCQFRHVWCHSLEYLPRRLAGPATIILTGFIDGDNNSPAPAVLVLEFGVATDIVSLTQELLHRVARQYIRLDLVGESHISPNLTERNYLNTLAHGSLDSNKKGETFFFPRTRPIRFSDDFKQGGPHIRESMIESSLS